MRPQRDDSKRGRRPLAALSLAVTVSVVGSLVLAPAALANFITPKSGGSPNANEIASLYRIILYIAAVVFVVVEGALLYSVIKFRAKKGAVAAQIHGNTRLEIGWTVAAALILVVLTIVTFIKLPSIIDAPSSNPGAVLSAATSEVAPPTGKKITICVQGRQFIWRYTYGNNCLNNAFTGKLPYSYTTMEAPVGCHRGAGHPGQRRHPLVVGAVPGRQGRRGAGLHDLHVVQSAAHRDLPRPVRAALRPPATPP